MASKIYSILLATTLVALASAATLGDFPGILGPEYVIVIGRNAAVDDVLSAIDLATRLAELATKEVTLPGAVQYEVRGWDARINLHDKNLTQGLPGMLINFDRNVLPQLKVLVVRNGTQTLTNVPEKVTYLLSNLSNAVYENTTLQLVLAANTPYFEYYINLSGKEVYADATKGIISRITLAGQQFAISSIGTDSVTILKGFGPEWISVGTVRELAGTNYKVRLDDVIGFGEDAFVRVSVLDENNNVVAATGLYPGQYDVVPVGDTEIKVVVLRAFGFGDQKMAYMVAGVEETVSKNKQIDKLFVWTVETKNGLLRKIGYRLQPNETVYLNPGESIVFPNNYLKLTYIGLTSSDKDYLATIKTEIVSIDGTKVTALNVANNTAIKVYGVPIYSSSKAYSEVYVVYNGTNATLAERNSTGYYVPISDSLTLGATGLDLNVNTTIADNNVEIRIGRNLTIKYSIVNGNVTSVVGSEDWLLGVDAVQSKGNVVYTAFGHKVKVSNDAKVVEASWTPVQVFARLVLGEARQKTTEGGTIKQLDVTKLSKPVARFDDQVTLDSGLTTNLVVVGGPVVNRVAAKLLGVEYGNFTAAQKYFEKANAIDKAIIKLVENVAGSGKNAIVIAGWRASDTRLACQLLQQYDKHTAELAGKTGVVVGGILESPTITELTA